MLNLLLPVRMDSESARGIFFLDFTTQKAYGIDGAECSDTVAAEIFSGVVDKNRESFSVMPYEQISEVLRVEKKLSEDNGKHIFRRP